MRSKAKTLQIKEGITLAILLVVVVSLSNAVPPSPPGPTLTTSTHSSTSTKTASTTATSPSGDGIKFSSTITPSTLGQTAFTYGNNFPTPGSSFPVEVNETMQINEIQFWLSDRAYDPNNETVMFESPSGTVMATGTLSLWGPYGKTGDLAAPLQLSSVITLQPSTRYNIAFSTLPSSDNYGCSGCLGISQDLITEAAPTPAQGYLGQKQWPIFTLGLMTLGKITNGLAVHNYGGITDLFSSAGYDGNTEDAMRFYVSTTEQLRSFELNALCSDGSGATLTISLEANSQTGGSHPAGTIMASGSLTAAQAMANITTNPSAPKYGTSGFIGVNFPSAPTMTGGNYYWIVLSDPSTSTSNFCGGTSNGQPVPDIVFMRLVNPYTTLMITSQNAFSTWGVPADGPSELSYMIVTSKGTINNAIYGAPENDAFSQVAQSFVPGSTTTISGVWTEANQGNYQLNVYIETNNNGSPSGTIIASGKTSSAYFYGGIIGANQYISLSAVSVSKGSTYWIVFAIGPCLTGSCSSPNNYYGVQYLAGYPYAPAGHYETNIGGSWTSPSVEGTLNFVLTTPA